MNERCQICTHSPASHRNWGNGGCEAQTSGDYCRCVQYLAPPLNADPMGSPPAMGQR